MIHFRHSRKILTDCQIFEGYFMPIEWCLLYAYIYIFCVVVSKEIFFQTFIISYINNLQRIVSFQVFLYNASNFLVVISFQLFPIQIIYSQLYGFK